MTRWLSNRLAALDSELADIFGDRDQPAFPLLVEGWCGAVARELTRLEFSWDDAQELIEQRLGAAIREARFTGVLPPSPS